MKNRLDVQKLALSCFAAAMAFASTQEARADLRMDFAKNKTATQTNAFAVAFDGGEFTMDIRDGLIIYSPCAGHPSPVPLAPSLSCPLGTTAQVVTGDADRDGTRDDNSYWSVTNVVPAYSIEPYRPDLVSLAAAPTSPLPRPIGLFQDEAVTIFFDTRTVLLQYDQTRYSLDRPYAAGLGNLVRMDRELPIGQYVFSFPQLNYPSRPVALPASLTAFVEPFVATTTGKSGLRVINGRWNAGKMEIDPRVLSPIRWQGTSSRNIRTSVDTLQFYINNAADTTILFPSAGPLTIPNPLTTTYTVPPFFFSVGDEGVAHIVYSRNAPVSGVSYDTSKRDLKFPIRFIDTYAGFAQLTFPVGSSASKIRATADYDGDGFSNLVEYAYQSECDVTAVPPKDDPGIPNDPTTTGNFVVTDLGGGSYKIVITKRAGVSASLTYGAQSSSSPGRWVTERLPTTVGATLGRWKLNVNDATTMEIETVTPYAVPPLGFRPYAKQNY